jgi:hypothetical protein
MPSRDVTRVALLSVMLTLMLTALPLLVAPLLG